MSRRHTVMLVALSLIWGASFMFIKIAVREFDPLAVAWLRLTLAAIVIVPIALRLVGSKAITEARAAPLRLTAMGLVNSAFPFALISWAETRIDSGLAAILQAAAPLFTVLISVRTAHERVSGSRLAGVLVGFVGVALLVGAHSRGGLLPALAVIAAALCYSAAGVFGSRRLRDTEPIVVAAGSMVTAAVLMTPIGLAASPDVVPGWKEITSVLVLGIVGTGIAYIIYFALLRGAGASRAILVTYLVPPTALAYGVLLLGEPLRVAAVAGLAFILGGVALAARRRPVASAR